MKNILCLLLILFIRVTVSSQLSSIVIRNDTTFSVNPSTRVWTPLIPSSTIWSNIPTTSSLSSYSLTSHTHTFSSLTSKPTTLTGYGITDGLKFSDSNVIDTKAWRQKGIDSLQANISLKANSSAVSNVTNESKATMFTSPAFTGTPTGITATHVGLGNVNNTSDAAKPISTATQTALDLKANLASPTFTGTVVLPNSTVTNAMLAGSIDLTSKVTGVLPFANGGIGSGAATSATTGTMTVNMTTEMITITPTNACIFNASGGVTGQRVTFVITTSGVSSFVLTWGTNFRTTATLATGTTTAKIFCVTFLYNGSLWLETNRTAAM